MQKNSEKTICVHFVDFLFKYASAKKININKICKKVGFDVSVLNESDARIGSIKFEKIWSLVAKECNEHNFGRNLGSSFKGLSLNHIVFSVMLNAGSVIAALEKFVIYHNLMSDIASPVVTEVDSNIHFSIKTSFSEVLADRHYKEFIFSMVITVFKLLSSNKVLPVSVFFTHENPDVENLKDDSFCCPVFYNRKNNRIVFNKQDLEIPINLSDPQLLPFLEMMADRKLDQLNTKETWIGKVKKEILNSIGKEQGAIFENMCKSLGIGKRTLQAKLKDEGVSFQNLYNELRKEKAIVMLKNKQFSIIDIAFFMGFSEQSAFNHAFKKWTGLSPGEFRKDKIGTNERLSKISLK